ncbi:MAG: tryptophan synthase subunit beta, partial [Sphaerochaetaceae bacterium]
MAKTQVALNTLQPDEKGFFGPYGGAYIPEPLEVVMNEISEAYLKVKDDPTFIEELTMLQQTYTGRPSPVY